MDWKKGDICGYSEQDGRDEFFGIFDHDEPTYWDGRNRVFSIAVLALTFHNGDRQLIVRQNDVYNYWGIHKITDEKTIQHFYDLLEEAGYVLEDGKWVCPPDFNRIKEKFEKGNQLTNKEIQYLIDNFKA